MELFAHIIHGLHAYLWGRARPMHTVANPFLESVRVRLTGILRRFNALFVKWRAGKLPQPGTPRPGRVSKPNPDRPRFPSKRFWLRDHTDVLLMNHRAAIEYQFQSNPEYARFLAEVPQAGRILRPLYHMLGIDLPDPIRHDPPPRQPRAPRPRKPRLPPLQPHASTSPLHLRLEVPGIPNRRRRRKPL